MDAAKVRKFHILSCRWHSKIVRKRPGIPREPTLRREQPVRSEDLSGELQGEPEGFQLTETKDDAEARANFWSIQGDFIHRHHIEPRVQLCAERRNIPSSTDTLM